MIKSQDQITIVDVTDAYSVILASETFTFMGGTDGAPAGMQCMTQVAAYCGSNQCPVVNVNQNDIVCPEGIVAEVSNSGNATPTIVFKTIAVISQECEATIPVIVDGITINKKFSFAVAKAGAVGAQGPKGDKGDTGAQGPKGDTGDKGDTGAAGADAIALVITSSNGTVFKNNTGSTVLTAHVYIGGIEQEITDEGVCGEYGSIKWYEGEELKMTSKTYTVNAMNVVNTSNITCKLEG